MPDEPQSAGGRPPGSKNKKQPLKVADIALEINLGDFAKTKAKYGRSFTPKLACRIIEHMRKVGGEEASVPQELQDYANTKRPGRAINGPMTAPQKGEVRPYTVSAQRRIGLSTETIDGESGKKVYTYFGDEVMITSKKKPGEEIFIVEQEGSIIISKEPLGA